MACNLNYMRRRMQLGAQPHKAKASGAVATFRTNLAAKLDSLFVDVTPVQDLHGQQYPYPAGGGKNIFNKDGTDSEKGYVSGYYLFATGVLNKGSGWRVSEYIKVDQSTQYTVSGISGNSPAICQYDSEKAFVSGTAYGGNTSATITTGASVAYVRISYKADNVGAVQLEKGATATAYAPYSNVCPITGWAAAKVESAPNIDIGTLYNNGLDDYGEVNTYTYYRHTDYIDVRNAEQVEIAFYAIDSGWTYRACAYDANKQFIELLDKKTHTPGRAYGYTYDSTALDGVVYLRFSFIKSGSNPTVKHFAVVDSLQVVQFGQTLYGARIDWKGRKAVCTHVLKTFDGVNNKVTSVAQSSATGNYYAAFALGNAERDNDTLLCNMASFISGLAVVGTIYQLPNGDAVTVFADQTMTTKAQVDTFLQSNNLQIYYKLATPVEIPLDLVDFVTVPGINNVFADCGNTDLSYWTNI